MKHSKLLIKRLKNSVLILTTDLMLLEMPLLELSRDKLIILLIQDHNLLSLKSDQMFKKKIYINKTVQELKVIWLMFLQEFQAGQDFNGNLNRVKKTNLKGPNKFCHY